MRQSVLQKPVLHEIPVRWYERTWESSVGTAVPHEPPDPVVSATPSARSNARRPAIGRRNTVTTRDRFSQPSRAQRHRR